MIFRFKEFEVKHDKSLLKVGTDAVVLGALIHSKIKISHALDIGTGCGVIGLMVAQKFLEAQIEAIEIDPASYEEASLNFLNSKFNSRLKAIHTSLQNFKTEVKYDLIFSNPPYFETPDFSKGNNPQNIKEERKKLATQYLLSFEELISYSRKMLTANGKFWVIIPFSSKEKFISVAGQNNLYPEEEISIRSKPNSAFIRSVLCFGIEERIPFRSNELIIYNKDGTRSVKYSRITDEYYL